jgi:acyl-homoserine lactone acylase PvdQ
MRLREAIMEKGKFDQNDMAKLRADIKCTPEVRALLPILLEALEGAKDVTDEIHDAADLLKAWDFRFSRESVAATIFDRFVRELPQAVAKQHLGEHHALAQFDMLRLAPDSRWYDDPSTQEVETRPDLFVKVFGKILADLAEQLGPDKSKWVWGKVSTTKVLHLVEDVGLSDRLKPPDYGDFVMEGSKGLTPHVLMVVTYSQVVDLTDMDKAQAVLSVGNSELYTSPHSHDQIDLWSNWQLRPAFLGEDKLKETSHLTTVLTTDTPHGSAQGRPG